MALKVYDEAINLEQLIEDRVYNAYQGFKPDLDSYFQPLEGQYKTVYELTPHKGYGPHRPSFLRFYAIKITKNCYVIVYGGIKIGRKISDSPILQDEVIQRINKVLKFFKDNGITAIEDF